MSAARSLLGAPFAALARARGAKAFHPKGVVHEGTLRLDEGALPGLPREHRALIRFSRALGLPERLPDLFGIAIRLPDVHGPGRHQDFLTVTTIDAPILHHGFVPVTDAQQTSYTSAVPYRAGAERFLIGVQPLPGSPRPDGDTIGEKLERAAATGRLRFGFAIAPLMGRFRTVGELRVGDRLSDDRNALRFNPWNTGGGLEPTGILNAWRRFSYPASQEAWSDGVGPSAPTTNGAGARTHG